ncbi:MAG: heterodisulfide reductase-related iron-sulfur binding cluster [Anaerolineae bacterium]
MSTTLRTDLAHQVMEECGENVYLCYQCKKCTAGCPVAPYFDLTPNQVMRAVQLGMRDLVLNSRTIWLCAACETCTTRCPQGIDIARVMDVLEIMAQREGIRPKVRPVPMFYKAANRGIDWFGRMFELGLMAELYARMFFAGELDLKQLFRYDVPMAIKMLRTGKLKILPSVARPADRQKAPPADENTIAYYPGCSLHATGIEYDMSMRAVAERLGLNLVEPEGWICCGTSPAHSTDHFRSIVLPARNLALIEAMGHSYVTVPCAACFSRFRIAMHELTHDKALQDQVAQVTGYQPDSGMRIDAVTTTFVDYVGLERVRQQVTRPLEGLKVACYYGCLLTRPPEATGEEEYEYPTNMDRLMETLGATPVDWNYKTDCCGGSLSLSQLEISLDLSRKILEDAKLVGADCIVTACPLCHANLDMRQRQISERFGGDYHIPIFYVTQLMGVAFGVERKRLGLEKHFSDALGLMRRRGFLSA